MKTGICFSGLPLWPKKTCGNTRREAQWFFVFNYFINCRAAIECAGIVRRNFCVYLLLNEKDLLSSR